ncbi:lipopolysaccharide-induced tumor necrosis factor-alpha factor homolog [Oppia nitens]|uniref:lipopolysaccharide-induced tumor necrosis factor-alpha factor homolog n=1 Tax=Oppia nitens TaxID=1686743 RepID=UPI0023DB26EC|nr:lipopolysaccharide-induced tumor necrosis factor-alpha factor homolog [Oppia nitens]
MTSNVRQAMFGEQPVKVTCAQCGDVTTRAQPVPGLLSYLLGGLLCAFGCICGCCLIPCMCCQSVQDVDHNCPKCMALLGRYKRI